jgi:hypothetical protein
METHPCVSICYGYWYNIVFSSLKKKQNKMNTIDPIVSRSFGEEISKFSVLSG